MLSENVFTYTFSFSYIGKIVECGYASVKNTHSPCSQIGPVHPLGQMQLPARHVPPFSHGVRQKSRKQIFSFQFC